MKAIIQNSILACLAFCLGTACTEEAGVETAINGKGYLEVYATIGDASTVQSRADNNTQNTDKFGVGMDNYFSYLSGSNTFVNGCQIGLFSANGTDGVYDKGRLVNVPLTYTLPNGETYGSFVNEDIEISSMTNLGHTFAYYPYSAINKASPQTGNSLTYDIDLYVHNDGTNNPYNTDNKNKVIDLLKASNNGTISGWRINYTFSHACSMLTIERGIGFNGKDWTDGDNEVLVKLENGLKGYITRTTGNFTFDVKEDDSAPVTFPANYYTYTNNKNEVIKIHSVILPPKAKVEYIKIMDDFGTWQYVRPEGNILQSLEAGNRYPVTVELDGPSPTIYPHEITPWDDEMISIENKNAGIYDLAGLKGWMNAYNNNGDLSKYGYGTTVGDETQWIFYLYADIDCSELTEEEEYQYFVQTFKDRLEGHGHTLKNIQLTKKENGNIGLIGELNGGSINNLKIDGISISGGTDAYDCTGTIAGTITGGSITECKITGININCEKGLVGSLAGKATSGTVDICLLEGNLRLGKYASIADGQKLFGEKTESFILDETNTSGVYVFKAEVDNAETGENAGSPGDDSGTNNGDGTTGGN